MRAFLTTIDTGQVALLTRVTVADYRIIVRWQVFPTSGRAR